MMNETMAEIIKIEEEKLQAISSKITDLEDFCTKLQPNARRAVIKATVHLRMAAGLVEADLNELKEKNRLNRNALFSVDVSDYQGDEQQLEIITNGGSALLLESKE